MENSLCWPDGFWANSSTFFYRLLAIRLNFFYLPTVHKDFCAEKEVNHIE